MQAQQILRAFNFKHMTHAGLRLDFVQVGAQALSGIHRTLVIDGVQHAGNFEVDAVERLSRDDGGIVDAWGAATDDFVILGVFELDGFEIGRRKGGGFFGKRTIGERTLGWLMDDAAGGSDALGFSDRPGLRRGCDKHLTARGADAAKRVPIDRRGRAATGTLRTVFRFVEIGLLNANVFPIDVEFFGDEHWHAGFDALPDFGILAHDRDDAIGGDAHKREGLKRSGGRLWRGSLRRSGKRFRDWLEMIRDEDSAASDGRNFEKGAAIEERGVHGTSIKGRGRRNSSEIRTASIVSPMVKSRDW